MNAQEYRQLQAEKSTVQRLLADIPADRVLERSGLEARVEEVDEQLASMAIPRREPARAKLTFRGRPVVAHRGVFAEFGAKATSLFTDAVAKVAAALSGPLSAMGPVPNRSGSQLLITNTAIGSFGFELEEYRPNQLEFEEYSTAGQALEVTRRVLESTLGTDDELADSAAATDPRAVAAIREFLELLVLNEAVCALEYNERVMRFKDVGDVRRAVERLGQDNLHEAELSLMGEFQGALPKGGVFEFKVSESSEIIRGKIGPGICAPDNINRHLHQSIAIQVLATRVGHGRPRYVLLKLPEWGEGE